MTYDRNQDDLQDRPLVAFVALAQKSLGHLTPEQCLRGERRITEKWATTAYSRSWRNPKFLMVAALLSGLIGVGLLLRRAVPVEPLAFHVENGYLGPAQSVRGGGNAGPVVKFTDGTEVRLAQGTQARIRFVTPKGAGLVMDRGQLHAQVVHSAQAEWQFDAGPFTVRVTGTSFGLQWEPDHDRFDLRLEQGSVMVTGPVANEPIPVRSGQWLTIRTRSNEVLIRDLMANTVAQADAVPSVSEPPVAMGTNEVDSGALTPATVDETRSRVSGATESNHKWVSELAQGHLESIVRDARARGLDECLSKSSSEELSALADAARYTRNTEIAQRALIAIRQRFSGSRKATDAAFLLGKMAEAAKNEAGALAFFNTYLTEAPNGTYASDALGRKMAIVRNTSGSVTARPLARDYLVKYPRGTYASAAQAILDNP